MLLVKSLNLLINFAALTTSYTATMDYLYNRLPVFHKIGKAAYKKDLTNTLLLLEAIGNPHQQLKCIHIAGTNGKGSVSSFLHSIMVENGYRSALYTSPHLLDFRERIRLDRQNIDETFIVEFVEQIKPHIERIDPSFFEVTVAMAFAWFARQKPEVCIIEAGLGGRLDSTNVITPCLSIITNIGYDHMDILGNTLEQIASEKAGIIKPGVPVVIGETLPQTLPVFEQAARSCMSSMTVASGAPGSWITNSALKGSYQQKNLATVYAAVQELTQLGFAFEESAILKALKNVTPNSGLRGRWEILNESPFIVADTAHNGEGLKYTLSQFMAKPHRKPHFVLGFVNDKDLDKVLPLFPKEAQYYFTRPSVFRGLEASVLKEKAAKYGLAGEVYNDVNTAFHRAKTVMHRDDILYVGGSTFVVADLLAVTNNQLNSI